MSEPAFEVGAFTAADGTRLAWTRARTGSRHLIVVSPGIGNQAASVPEPGTWALFGLGAAMVVLRARRVRHS